MGDVCLTTEASFSGFDLGFTGQNIGGCSISPGRVRHTRLATSRVMHMNAISNTIWKKRRLHKFCEVCAPSASFPLTVAGRRLSLPHPEWEAERSVVGLESHRSSLLQNGLVGCVQALANRRRRVIVVVVVVSGGRVVVVVVVDWLVGVIVLLLPEEIGVEVPVEVEVDFIVRRNIAVSQTQKVAIAD